VGLHPGYGSIRSLVPGTRSPARMQRSEIRDKDSIAGSRNP